MHEHWARGLGCQDAQQSVLSFSSKHPWHSQETEHVRYPFVLNHPIVNSYGIVSVFEFDSSSVRQSTGKKLELHSPTSRNWQQQWYKYSVLAPAGARWNFRIWNYNNYSQIGDLTETSNRTNSFYAMVYKYINVK